MAVPGNPQPYQYKCDPTSARCGNSRELKDVGISIPISSENHLHSEEAEADSAQQQLVDEITPTSTQLPLIIETNENDQP